MSTGTGAELSSPASGSEVSSSAALPGSFITPSPWVVTSPSGAAQDAPSTATSWGHREGQVRHQLRKHFATVEEARGGLVSMVIISAFFEGGCVFAYLIFS